MKYRVTEKVEYNPLYYVVLAGMIAAIVQSIYERPLILLHIIDSGLFEHAEQIIMDQNIPGWLAASVGIAGHLVYSGLCGGIFALVVNKYAGYEYFMGTGMGLTAWITVMFVTTTLSKHKTGQEEALHAVLLLVGGAVVGASSWLIIYGYFVHTGALGLYKASDIPSGLTTLIFDTGSGIISALVLVYLAKRVKT